MQQSEEFCGKPWTDKGKKNVSRRDAEEPRELLFSRFLCVSA